MQLRKLLLPGANEKLEFPVDVTKLELGDKGAWKKLGFLLPPSLLHQVVYSALIFT